MSDSKKLVYALIGVGALVGGAIAFHYLSGKESSNQQCFDDIDSLGPPKKNANGLLDFQYYKNVFVIINKHSKSRFADEKKNFVAARRRALKANNDAEYKNVVKEMIQKEEQNFGDLLTEAMEHIGMSEQEFMQMHQMYMSNPQT